MIKKKVLYYSDLDLQKEEFSSKKEAIEYEKEITLNKELKNFKKLLRKYFKNEASDKFTIKCENCDKILIRYDTEYNGIDRTYRGKKLFQSEDKCHEFLDGIRCDECHKKSILLFKNIIKENNENIGNFIDMFHIDSGWEELRSVPLKLQLYIYECLENYNKKRKGTK
jgi:hypothetical protein